MPILTLGDDTGPTVSKYSLGGGSGVAPSQASGLPTQVQEDMTRRLFNQVNQLNVGVSTPEMVARWVYGTGVDLADSIWGNRFNPLGERGDVWSVLGTDAEKEFYERNKPLIEGSSAITGLIGTAVATNMFVLPRIAQGLADSTYISGTKLWKYGEALNADTRAGMLAAQMKAAQAGQQYRLLSSKFGSAGMKFLALEGAKGLGYAAAEEASMYLAMNANGAAYSDDVSTNLFWSLAGLTAGAGAGLIAARADARKFANSPLIRDTRAGIVDPTRSFTRLMSDDVIDQANAGLAGEWRMKQSAKLTEYWIARRAEAAADASSDTQGRIIQLQSEAEAAATKLLQIIDSTGVDGIKTAKGKVMESRAWRNFNEVAKDDPFLAFGLDRAGVLDESAQGALKSRQEHIEFLRKEADVLETRKGNVTKARELRYTAKQLENQDGYLFIASTWHGIEDKVAQQLAHFDPKETLYTKSPNTGGLAFRRVDSKTQWVDDSFALGAGTNRSFEDLNIIDQQRTVEAINRIQRSMIAKKQPYVLSQETVKKGDWFTLSAVAEFARKGGKVELGKSGLSSIDEVTLKSLQSVADRLLAKRGATDPITQWDRLSHNLPLPNTFERIEDPAGDTIRAWLKGVQATKSLKKPASDIIGELYEALDNARTVQGFQLRPSQASYKKPLSADVFNWNRDKRGDWIEPIVGYFDRNSHMQDLQQTTLMEDLTRQKLYTANTLLQKMPQGPFRAYVETIYQMPETRIAQNIGGLSDEQVTGNSGVLGQLASEVLTQRMRWRDNPTMLAASRAEEIRGRVANAILVELADQYKLTEAASALTSTGRAHQKVMVDQWFSNRHGWDIDFQNPVKIKGDKYAFELLDTEKNQKRLGVDSVEEGTLLRNSRNDNIIVLDDYSLGVVQRFSAVADKLLDSANAIRTARGIEPIRRMDGFVPSPNTKNKRIGFVFNEMDELIPGKTIVASTDEEYENLVRMTNADLEKEYGSLKGIRILEKTQVELRHRSLWEKNQMDWIDPGMGARPNASQTGKLSGAFVSPHGYTDALDWVRRTIEGQTRDIQTLIFQDQIDIAKAMSNAERAIRGGETQRQVRNIYEEYANVLTGKPNAYSESALTGRVLSAAEEVANRVLRTSKVPMNFDWVSDVLGKAGIPTAKVRAIKTHEQLVKTLGDYSPYKSAVDYAEQSLNIRVPKDIRHLVQKASWLSASLILRWDITHAAMNMLGIMSTLPTLIQSGRAPISVGFKTATGKTLNVVDTGKIFAGSFKDMISTRSAADWNHMVRMGDATQQVAEYHQAMAAVQSQTSFKKFMSKADHYLAWLSQSSENWSRQWAHFAGLRLADYHGIKGMAARHDFAREIANAAIADYAPVNRPELFQTGLGGLYGQFMSYMLGQNMKLFRWMENREYKQFGTQLALQASMFGVLGVPAARQLVSMYDSWNDTGGTEPTGLDRLYAQFGPVAGQMLANGGMNIFGLAFHTRGDLSIRTPAPDLNEIWKSAPAISILSNVVKTVVDTTGIILSGHTDTMAQQLLEVVTREMPNRVARGWLAVLNGGQEIDPYGNVASDTKTWLDTAARVIGMRSTRQQAELEQYYQSKSVADRDAAKMDATRERLRTATRIAMAKGADGTIDVIGFYDEYVKNGGNPANFRTWFRGVVREAGSTRAVNALKRSLSNPANHLDAWRFGAYGAAR